MQRTALRWKKGGQTIGFVPTMGYLHDGHLSLIRHARKILGAEGKIVVSIYVNPTQFAPNEDLAKYPRDFKGDCAKCKAAGADLVFSPTDGEMYLRSMQDEQAHSTFVAEEILCKSMEGVSRPTHFRGVTTVVAKLFNITLPDVAIFGQKDFQQAAVIRRMVRDLNFPVRVIVAPTVREADGLAMSSRNKYLSADQRKEAPVLRRTILHARNHLKALGRKGVSSGRLRSICTRRIEENGLFRVDYIEFFDPETLVPTATVRSGTRMALAAFIGKTRLIDNDVI